MGIGLLISSVVATMQQALLFSFVLVLALHVAVGAGDADHFHAALLQIITLVNPLRYAIDLTHRVYLEGTGLANLTPDLWPLAVIAVLTLSSATWMFRHRLA